MKQLINRPEVDTDDNPSIDTGELTRMAFPYLLQLFHAGLEKRHGQRLSIQCLDSGTFRGTLTAIADLGESSERGEVTFTNSESIDGVLAYFEDSLTYGELKWRLDKFWAAEKLKPAKKTPKRKKIPLRL